VVSVDRAELLIIKWNLDPCCASALDEVDDAFEAFTDDGDASAVEPLAVATALGHGIVAHAFADYVLERRAGDERLRRFATFITGRLPARRSAPVSMLLAMEAESRGDVVGAEAAVRTAVRANPKYGPPIWKLASYQVDRGDLSAAIATVRQHSAAADPPGVNHLEKLRAELPAPLAGVARNQPCTCGSGLKYKACCQDRPVPLASRTRLLAHKLARFASAEERRVRLLTVARSACGVDQPDLVPALATLAGDGAIVDFALFEGGIADEYLATRGALLPADERELLESVAADSRRMWEVTAANPGAGVTLRDAAGGEVVDVRQPRDSRPLQAGDHLVARVAQLRDENQIIGVAIPVGPPLRAGAAALVACQPDAEELARWYGQALASTGTKPGAATRCCCAGPVE
jgi:SEC-C motif-containing protein